MLRSKQFAMFVQPLRPRSRSYQEIESKEMKLFRKMAQRVTTQRPSLSFVELEVHQLAPRVLDHPEQNVFHLLQHRLNLVNYH